MTVTLIIILFALALDRFFPDRGRIRWFAWYEDWVRSVELRFNAGTRGQGVAAVVVVAGPLILGVFVVRYVLSRMSYSLVYIFDILVLYLCLDLYRLARSATAVSESLESGDLLMAASHLEGIVGKTMSEVTESSIAQATVFRRPLQTLALHQQHIDEHLQDLRRMSSQWLTMLHQRLNADAGRLEGLSPLKVLARGYSITQKLDGSVVRRAADVAPGDVVKTVVSEGSFTAKVE